MKMRKKITRDDIEKYLSTKPIEIGEILPKNISWGYDWWKDYRTAQAIVTYLIERGFCISKVRMNDGLHRVTENGHVLKAILTEEMVQSYFNAMSKEEQKKYLDEINSLTPQEKYLRNSRLRY